MMDVNDSNIEMRVSCLIKVIGTYNLGLISTEELYNLKQGLMREVGCESPMDLDTFKAQMDGPVSSALEVVK